jgi:hypothetical protein
LNFCPQGIALTFTGTRWTVCWTTVVFREVFPIVPGWG